MQALSQMRFVANHVHESCLPVMPLFGQVKAHCCGIFGSCVHDNLDCGAGQIWMDMRNDSQCHGVALQLMLLGYSGVQSQLVVSARTKWTEQSSVTAAAAVEAAKLDEWKAELLGEMKSLRSSVQAVAARPMQQQQLQKQPVSGVWSYPHSQDTGTVHG